MHQERNPEGRLTDRVTGLDLHVPGHTGLAIRVGHEARVLSISELHARLVESGLGRGVVEFKEDEADSVANSRVDRLRSVLELGQRSAASLRDGTTDGDGVNAAGGGNLNSREGRGREERGEESGSMHYAGG
jgi:hypothetical protein